MSISDLLYRDSVEIRVFLNYATEDADEVRKLYDQLTHDRFHVWFAEHSLVPGQTWEAEIKHAIQHSHVVVVCLSHRAITKRGYVQKEITLALDIAEQFPERSIFIIPAKLDDCQLPQRLRKWQSVNLVEANGYPQLKKAILSSRTAASMAELCRPAMFEAAQQFEDAAVQLLKDVSYDNLMRCCLTSRLLWTEACLASHQESFLLDDELKRKLLAAFQTCFQALDNRPYVPYAKMMNRSIRNRYEFLQTLIHEGPNAVTRRMEQVAEEL